MRRRAPDSPREQLQRALAAVDRACRKRGQLGGARGLPWLLLLGTPGSGKTTALLHGGPPLTSCGGSARCGLCLGSEALFLEVRGEQVADDAEWARWLRRQRRWCPVDAVLLQVGADELLDRAPAERERCAAALRQRLDELLHLLGVQVPIHLLVNKLDLLDGSAEFVTSLAETERHRAWGFTLDLAAGRPVEETAVEAQVDARLSELVAAANGWAQDHLVPSAERAAREAALTFPTELEALRAPLRGFLAALLRSSANRDTPTTITIYLASAGPTGERPGGLRQRLAAELGLPPSEPAPPARQPQETWFLRGAFARLLRHAEGAARPSEHRRRRRLLTLRAAVLASVLGCLLGGWLLGSRYCADLLWLERLQAAAQALQKTAGVRGPAAEASDDQISAELHAEEDLLSLISAPPPAALFQPHGAASTLLRQRIAAAWLHPLSGEMHEQLRVAATIRFDQPGADFDRAFRLLKAGRILDGQPCAGVPQQEARAAIARYLLGEWQRALGPARVTLKADEESDGGVPRSNAARLLNSLGFYFAQALGEAERSDLRLDPGLREVVRANLRTADAPPGVLFMLRAANANLYTRTPQAHGALVADGGIEEVFTRAGCARFFATTAARATPWWECVLGVEARPEGGDLEVEYRRRYLEAWNGWLRSLEPRAQATAERRDSLQRAGDELEVMFRPPRAELAEVLALVGRGRAEAPLPRPLRQLPSAGCGGWLGKQLTTAKAEVRELELPAACRQAEALLSPFAQLTMKPAPEGNEPQEGAPAELYGRYLRAAQALRSVLYELRDMATDKRNARALDLVQKTLGGAGELWTLAQARRALLAGLDERLRPAAAATGSGLERILVGVERDAWRAVLPLAVRAVDDRWQAEVFERWSALRLRHKKYAAPDAERVADLVEFAKTLKDFSRQVLAPLYQGGDPGRCSLTGMPEGPFAEGLPLDKDACAQLQRFLHIAETTDPKKALGSAGTAARRAPISGDVALPRGCAGYNARAAQLDDGEVVHTCLINSTRCTHAPSLHKRPTLSVSWGESIAFTRYLQGEDYGEFLRSPGTVDGNRLTFVLPAGTAPGQCAGVQVSFELQPAQGGGSAPGRPDTQWKTLELPRSLMRPQPAP